MDNKLFNMDCIEFMSTQSELGLEFDLIVSDPPYLIDYQSNHRTKSDKFKKIVNDTEENIHLINDYFYYSNEMLKNNSSIYIFCDFKTIDIFKPLFEKFFKLKNLLIWKKNNWGMGDLSGAYAHQYEMILYGHKGKDKLRGKRYPDVLEFDRISGQNLTHPTEKPVDLLKFLIENSSDEGDLVFDGFAGSSSTLIAAKQTNRRYLGCELEWDYYVEASKKLDLEFIGPVTTTPTNNKKQLRIL